MATPLNPSGALKKAQELLQKVLKTRLQRKAKSIIMSSLEFLLIDLAVLSSALEMELGSKYQEAGVGIVLGGSAVYVILLSLVLFFHAISDKTDSSTTEEVEDAYTNTNKIPVWDGILELSFPARFKGKMWYLPYIAWVFTLIIIVWGVLVFEFGLGGPNEDEIAEGLTATTQAALSAGVVLLYQITSDFGEYWVQSRPINRTDEEGDVASGEGEGDAMVAAVSDA